MAYSFKRRTYYQDPGEELDYGFDLTKVLNDGELISTVEAAESPTGQVTLDTPATDGYKALTWVSDVEVGETTNVTIRAITNSTPRRVYERTVTIIGKQQ